MPAIRAAQVGEATKLTALASSRWVRGRPACAAQPMAAGDWTMPTAFFPGFAALQPAAAPSIQAKPKAAAKKGAADVAGMLK